MEISSFWIYAILQLDSIGNVVGFCAVMSALMTLGLAVFYVSPYTEYGRNDPDAMHYAKVLKPYLKFAASMFVSCVVMLAVLPSSKSAAVIFLLPKIANNEFIQSEAQELYGLAKTCLKQMGNENKKTK